jgi:hypothetical protein
LDWRTHRREARNFERTMPERTTARDTLALKGTAEVVLLIG